MTEENWWTYWESPLPINWPTTGEHFWKMLEQDPKMAGLDFDYEFSSGWINIKQFRPLFYWLVIGWMLAFVLYFSLYTVVKYNPIIAPSRLSNKLDYHNTGLTFVCTTASKTKAWIRLHNPKHQNKSKTNLKLHMASVLAKRSGFVFSVKSILIKRKW